VSAVGEVRYFVLLSPDTVCLLEHNDALAGILAADGTSEEDEGSWQVCSFFLSFEGRPPICFLFHKGWCTAKEGGRGHLVERWRSCVWDALIQK